MVSLADSTSLLSLLADATRVRLLALLHEEELSVAELTRGRRCEDDADGLGMRLYSATGDKDKKGVSSCAAAAATGPAGPGGAPTPTPDREEDGGAASPVVGRPSPGPARPLGMVSGRDALGLGRERCGWEGGTGAAGAGGPVPDRSAPMVTSNFPNPIVPPGVTAP